MADLTLLLGHRGTTVLRSAPENTYAAFDAALSYGCDGFEFDVRRTADGRAVVVHDPKHRGISVAKAKRGQLTTLPRLEEVLEKYGSRGFLDIELKVQGLETALLAALREHPPVHGYVVSSFLPEVVLELRARRSGLPLGMICDKPSQLVRAAAQPVEYVMVQESLVSERLVDETHAAGRRLVAWTVNRPDAMLRLASWGVDGLVSDDPALLVRTLTGKGSAAGPAKPATRASSKGRGRGCSSP